VNRKKKVNNYKKFFYRTKQQGEAQLQAVVTGKCENRQML
jgi:hypothetical protein